MKNKTLLHLAGVITAVFLILALTNNQITAQTGNLVKNPSFETGGKNIGQDYNQNRN